jgi:hypothetical protein
MIDIEQFLMSLRRHTNADGKLNPIYLADTIQEEIEIIQGAIKHSQRWVGLTDEERDAITGKVIGFNSCVGWEEDYAKAVEAKLREKNNG